MLAGEPDLVGRVSAAVRVDARRWNLRIDNAIDVLLPEDNVGDAWARLAALEADKQHLEARCPDRRYAAARPAGGARRRAAAERGCAGEEARPSGKSI